ncbi:tRNA lysidine(34) synthetase TilS [Marivirga salinae]|uniref:tRNA(Ile)-lysidine synthase n=1 Tax=Marivirga salinarum TaxID=3059078 RepID=A0AA51NA06_9BACT|nr:tRNA lysidine(34) synthetase TilS [Marivirga sp. BDSF4-3]WMN11427.1 tRNA lysidine(34) synthetase TilS [Marivirga sp. BDSF4-3]
MLSASFLEFIKTENLFDSNEHLLLAISGGLDSVVLAHLLSQNNFHFSMAHMNFQLRGEDSNKDEEFVRELGKQLDVEIYVKRVEIDKDSGSTQIQARNLRYNWFDELMDKHSFDKLLTAHHANDLLETALLNLSRGTGIKGIRSILPLQNRISRPLLFAEKSEIKQFAQDESIKWREDISNASDHYTRNKIRHHIMPQLLELNPNLLTGFQQTALRLRATESAWKEKLEEIIEKYFQYKGLDIEIDKSILEKAYVVVYFSELLADYGFNLSHLQSFDFNRVGAQLFSSTYVLTVDREKILLSKLNDDNHSKFFPKKMEMEESKVATPFGSLKIEYINKEELSFTDNQNVAFIDFESLKKPFEIDLWNEGDKIQPIGMKGKKKISDILIDQKVPLPQKKRIMVLKSGGEIVWLIGYKFSGLFKVKKDTNKILRIEYYEGS